MYTNITSEMMNRMSQEGLPHMRLFGVWARISVVDHDIVSFCRYFGYRNGRKMMSIRTYGGFIWENFPSLKCLLNGGSNCLNKSAVKLQSEWYDGQYIKCNNAKVVPTNGKRTCANFRVRTKEKPTVL